VPVQQLVDQNAHSPAEEGALRHSG
jgi:hypothetical protein